MMSCSAILRLLILFSSFLFLPSISAATTPLQKTLYDSDSSSTELSLLNLHDALSRRLVENKATITEHTDAIDLAIDYIINTLDVTIYNIDSLSSLMVSAVDMGSAPKDKQANVVREVLRKLQHMKGSSHEMWSEVENILGHINAIEQEMEKMNRFVNKIEHDLAVRTKTELKPLELTIPPPDSPQLIEGPVEKTLVRWLTWYHHKHGLVTHNYPIMPCTAFVTTMYTEHQENDGKITKFDCRISITLHFANITEAPVLQKVAWADCQSNGESVSKIPQTAAGSQRFFSGEKRVLVWK